MEKSRLSVYAVSLVVLAVLAGAVAIKYVTSNKGNQGGWGGGAATPVVVAAVEPYLFFETVEAIGTARATESVDIQAKVTDTVRTINFEDAQVVEEGQILVELKDVEEVAGLAEARASLAEAIKEYNRTKELVDNGTASAARLDSIQSTRDRARAKVQAIEAQLADRIIRAPFAGVLGLRNVSVGSLVRPGDLITTLDDISTIKVDFSVPERFMAMIKKDQLVEATSVAYPDRAFEGTVMSFDSRIDPVTRAITVRAHLPNPEGLLRPGMLMSLTLILSRHEALAISESGVIPIKDDVFVYVVGDDMKAVERAIKTGMRHDGMVEVLSGLEQGDRIIVEGTSRIRRSGQDVRFAGDETDSQISSDAAPSAGQAGGKT